MESHKRQQVKTVGVTFGAFDLCHAGHFLMFKDCKGVCDYLIVGLHSDPSIDRPDKNKPIMSLEERLEILNGIKYIDEVFVYDTEKDLYEYLEQNQNRIDVRIIGEDWRGKSFTGHDLPIKVHFNSRTHDHSSSKLRKRVHAAEEAKVRS
jgi:glycerol-3-phosphate cytidylyltransferase